MSYPGPAPSEVERPILLGWGCSSLPVDSGGPFFTRDILNVNKMSTAKHDIELLLKKLPDDCSLEDVQYHLYARA